MSRSELAALLADATQNGVYFVDVHDRDVLAADAAALDYAVVAVDCAGCSDKDEVIARFAQALRLPEWFGGNFDALADCLGDLSWWPATGYLLLLDHIAAWRGDAPDDFAVLLDLLDETAGRWSETGTPFWTAIPLSAEALAETV